MQPSVFMNQIKEKLNNDKSSFCCKMEINQGKPAKGYQEHKSNYLRLYFNSADSRINAITLLENDSNHYVLVNNAKNPRAYGKMVARDLQISLCSWVEIAHNKVKKSEYEYFMQQSDFPAYEQEIARRLPKMDIRYLRLPQYDLWGGNLH